MGHDTPGEPEGLTEVLNLNRSVPEMREMLFQQCCSNCGTSGSKGFKTYWGGGGRAGLLGG